MTACPSCALPVTFVAPLMSAASAAFPAAQGPGDLQPRTTSLPRLDYVLTAAARAALATRRRGVRMAPETRAKIADTARRNRAARAAMVHHSLAAANSRGKSSGEAGSGVGGESGDRNEGGGAGQDGESGKAGRGRRMSEERRQKISAAMKGRSKSAEHRRKLSARFTGESNPMYGRKLSEETRARISSALAASRAARKAAAMGGGGGGDGEGGEQSKEQAVPPGLQEKALRSRFITSLSGPTQSEQELDEEAALDDLLARVAAGLLPPAAIQRMRHVSRGNTSKVDVTSSADKGDDEEKAVFVSAADASKAAPRRKNSEDSPWAKVRGEDRKRSTPAPAAIAAPRPEQISSGRKLSAKSAARRNALEKGHTEELPKCPTCLGSGSVVCEHCVGQVGVPSRHCTVCAGAAVTFCPKCLGAGELQPRSPQ